MKIGGLEFEPDVTEADRRAARDGDTDYTLQARGAPGDGWRCTARSTRWPHYSLAVDGPDRDRCVEECHAAAIGFTLKRDVSLECPVCGDDVFTADEDGLFYEDDTETCQECGTICRVSVSSDATEEEPGVASVSTLEEVEDIGQPKCDGSCGAVAEFVGTPCRWDCTRAVAWKKEQGA